MGSPLSDLTANLFELGDALSIWKTQQKVSRATKEHRRFLRSVALGTDEKLM